MQQKKPLFLLEIVIAIFLVGLFSAYFLRSSIGCLYQERKALLDLEFERQSQIQLMDLVTQNWHHVDQLPKLATSEKKVVFPLEVDFAGKKYLRTKTYQVSCPKKHELAYDLLIQEDNKKYHFLIKKEAAKT